MQHGASPGRFPLSSEDREEGGDFLSWWGTGQRTGVATGALLAPHTLPVPLPESLSADCQDQETLWICHHTTWLSRHRNRVIVSCMHGHQPQFLHKEQAEGGKPRTLVPPSGTESNCLVCATNATPPPRLLCPIPLEITPKCRLHSCPGAVRRQRAGDGAGLTLLPPSAKSGQRAYSCQIN